MPGESTSRWIDQYHRDGYYAPIRALSPEEAHACRARLEAFERDQGGSVPDNLRHRGHVFLVWLDELVRHPRILDAVERVLGENLLVWSSSLFIKDVGDGSWVPWHQDSRAYGPRAPDVVTAWVALSDSTGESGALRVIPGSHAHAELEHIVQHVPSSLLTRRREVALGVDDADAAVISLEAGEMSLHHPGLLHGSPPNRAADRRIGIAIRYVRPSAGRVAGRRESAMVVRGRDAAGAFDVVPRPERDAAPEALARHARLMNPGGPRQLAHIVAETWSRPVRLRGTLVTRGGQSVLLCGPSGCGKSVLAAALARRGWTWAPSGEGFEARHGTAVPSGRARRESPAPVHLAAILLLGRPRAGADGNRLSAVPPAHALLELLPYRDDASDAGDVARGIGDLRPLAEAVAVYEGRSASDAMADAVECLLEDLPTRPLEGVGSPTVWVEAPEPSEDRPAGHAAYQASQEGVHE